MGECRQCKQYGKDNGSAEEGLFQPPACVETGAEVVSTECASERCPRSLQKNCNDEKNREDDLHVGQVCRDIHGERIADEWAGGKVVAKQEDLLNGHYGPKYLGCQVRRYAKVSVARFNLTLPHFSLIMPATFNNLESRKYGQETEKSEEIETEGGTKNRITRSDPTHR